MNKPPVLITSLSVCLCSYILATPLKAVAAPEPPNVIVVNLDDIGPAWFPPYARQTKPEDVEEKICKEYAEMHKKEGAFDLTKHLDAACHSMPFLDALAGNGMVFQRCFATSSLCSPSRSALLTGCYQQRWGVFSLQDVTDSVGVPASVPVLAENFKKAGYSCGLVGKWHVALHDAALWDKAEKQLTANGVKAPYEKIEAAAKKLGYYTSSVPGQGPLDRGFNYYFGYNLDKSAYYEADNLWENNRLVPPRPAGEFLTDLFSSKCADFVTQAVTAKKHFLLYYAPMSMHDGLVSPPEKYSSRFHTGIKFTDDWAGHLLAVDEGLRKIYEILKANGQDRNTLFMLTADNGQVFYRVPPYNAPYRGGKGTGWLGGSHEPLIISWPAQIHGGIRKEMVSMMDIFATALDAAGLQPTQPIDGRSLLPLMRGETQTGPHEQLFCACLQSIAWSDPYFEPKGLEITPQWEAGNSIHLCWKEVKESLYPPEKTDQLKSPFFAWVQEDKSLLMYVSSTLPGLYKKFPDGRPQQKLFFNLQDDPREETNLYADTPAVKKATFDLGNWLKQTQPPHVKHASDYKELLEMGTTQN
jgi:uncharacterized sulfatase